MRVLWSDSFLRSTIQASITQLEMHLAKLQEDAQQQKVVMFDGGSNVVLQGKEEEEEENGLYWDGTFERIIPILKQARCNKSVYMRRRGGGDATQRAIGHIAAQQNTEGRG